MKVIKAAGSNHVMPIIHAPAAAANRLLPLYLFYQYKLEFIQYSMFSMKPHIGPVARKIVASLFSAASTRKVNHRHMLLNDAFVICDGFFSTSPSFSLIILASTAVVAAAAPPSVPVPAGT